MQVLYPKIMFNHPVVEVFKKIEVRMPFRQLSVLEPFGGDGTTQTVNYAYMPFVDRLVAWDCDPTLRPKFLHWIPRADVKTCNSFNEVHKLKPEFDVILIDNNLIQVPFEHFDLFPSIFKGLKDECFLIISVCVDPGGYYVQREAQVRAILGDRTEEWVKDWDRARADFYGFEPPTDDDYRACIGRIMPLTTVDAEVLVPVYMDMAVKAGFFTKMQTVSPRSRWMKYIVIEFSRASDRFEMERKTKDKLERIDAEEFKTGTNKP